MAVAAATLLWLTRGQTFFADEWNFQVGYPDWSPATLLHPNSGNLIAAPAVLYKALTAIFGGDDYLPFRIVWVALDLASAGLFFALARRRVGDWAALAPTILLLFFGASFEVLGGPLGITVLMAVASGLGMLLLLEREDRAGDVGAAVLLALSLASYTAGVAFAAGAVVYLVLVRGRAGRRSAWVVAGPLLLYGAWRVWAIHFGGTDVGVGDILTLPGSMAHAIAAVCASVSGTFRDPVNGGLAFETDAGRVIAVAVAVVVAWRLLGPRARPIDPRVWVCLAMALVYWALISANLGPLRSPDASRYQYPGAVLLLLLLTQLFAGVQLGRRGGTLLAAALGFCLLGNLAHLADGSRFLRDNGDENRGELTAVELGRALESRPAAADRAGQRRGLTQGGHADLRRRLLPGIRRRAVAGLLAGRSRAPSGERARARRRRAGAGSRPRPRCVSRRGRHWRSERVTSEGTTDGVASPRGTCLAFTPQLGEREPRLPGAAGRFRDLRFRAGDAGSTALRRRVHGRDPATRSRASIRSWRSPATTRRCPGMPRSPPAARSRSARRSRSPRDHEHPVAEVGRPGPLGEPGGVGRADELRARARGCSRRCARGSSGPRTPSARCVSSSTE